MVDIRTVTLPALWADDAITEIPTPPIANTTYRNTDLGSTELLAGWPFQKIVDSADFNQTLWLISNLVKSCEQYGIMPWCASTTYKQNGICLASNGIFYWAKKENTGVNPVNDSGMTNWGVFLDPGDNFVTETVLTSQIDLCEKLANKTQTLSSSSTTTQYPSAKAVYDNINNLQNSKQNNITGGASSITTNNLTTNRALISNGSGKVAVANVTSTELGYLDGVTSNIQNQLNGKQATITGGATTITSSNLTANRALISNGSGKVAVANVTTNELNCLDGVTSNIQNQLNGKQASGSYVTTNTAQNITATKTFSNNIIVNGVYKYLQFSVNGETYNMRGTGGTATGLSILEGNDPGKAYLTCERNGSLKLGSTTKYAEAAYSVSASDNSQILAYTSWVNNRITAIMNSSTSFGVPNYSTASSEIKMSNYNSTSSYWTAPYNCFATFYIKGAGGTSDSLWAIYAQASGSSSWNRAAGGGSGTYSNFEGAQLFFKANDKIYMTFNQSGTFDRVYMTYYRLTSA